MLNLIKAIFIAAIVAFCFISVALSSEVPTVVAYQGRLLDSGNNPVANGDYLIHFRLYDASSGGTELWNTGFRQVAVTDGLFTYLLGDSTAFADNLFDTYKDIWLGVKVGTDPEMTPRYKLVSTPYAMHALEADTAALAKSVPPGSIGITEINSSEVQARVEGAAPPGFYINSIDPTGAVTIAKDENSGGDITAVSAGTGLSGGGTSGSVTINMVLPKMTAMRYNTENHSGAVSSSHVKLRTIGIFRKDRAETDIEITWVGHCGVIGTFCDFQIRINDVNPGNFSNNVVLYRSEVGVDNASPFSRFTLHKGLSTGNHTISIWVRGSATDCILNTGNFSQFVYVRELYQNSTEIILKSNNSGEVKNGTINQD